MLTYLAHINATGTRKSALYTAIANQMHFIKSFTDEENQVGAKVVLSELEGMSYEIRLRALIESLFATIDLPELVAGRTEHTYIAVSHIHFVLPNDTYGKPVLSNLQLQSLLHPYGFANHIEISQSATMDKVADIPSLALVICADSPISDNITPENLSPKGEGACAFLAVPEHNLCITPLSGTHIEQVSACFESSDDVILFIGNEARSWLYEWYELVRQVGSDSAYPGHFIDMAHTTGRCGAAQWLMSIAVAECYLSSPLFFGKALYLVDDSHNQIVRVTRKAA